MAQELRYIFFNWSEIIKAVADYRKKSGQPLPPGTVVRRALRRTPVIEIDIIVAGDSGGEWKVTCNAKELGAALIMHCIDSAVPLPIAKASKSLRLVGQELALVIAMGGSVEELESNLESVQAA